MNTFSNQPIIIQNSEMKLYTKGLIAWGSYLGGPFAGCYLVSKNFEALGQKERSEHLFRLGIISTVVLFTALVFIPKSVLNSIPNSIIPLIYTVILYQYAGKTQGKAIDEHLKNGGQKWSGWKVTGIGIASLIITFIFYFSLLLLVPANLIG